MQTFTAPVTGNYKLEVWGAQGSGVGPETINRDRGGKGGYARANYSMNKEQTIYIAVGGVHGLIANEGGLTWNGGGAGDWGPMGGGATSIQKSLISDGQLKHYESVKNTDVLIVAGGGGGSEWYYTPTDYLTPVGGAGGGIDGEDGSIGYLEDLNPCPGAKGGTQTSGGKSTTKDSRSGTQTVVDGSFGQGGYTLGGDGGGQGGGGWYGGGAADYAGGGGGGSSHIGEMLTNGETIAGNQTFPSPSGGTETGHSGNGYAIISWISPSL